MTDVGVAFAFGAVGYLMKKHGWPRIPLVVALLLGGAIEMNLHITAQLSRLGRFHPLERPVLLGLAALLALSLWLPFSRGLQPYIRRKPG